ncbi:hypothetical protein HETIRDRAFT_40944 [Heterobasidion irregulare TC 32-1]|uniref:FAM192A/Fyv6 N-terminal domain-containing protein n=1 Tax=Heterobasidion irregulare (strain TC 32-1) TaxID=747525 RepID=W4KQL7_HETIT|nr:uncharacterized protein HETIRDRAFT_40944 [Heterobasidion irregulare TC 32-1]ETW87331.1 hypothetical protein HETIRDRAFT_40944 [Heterobasidion irregulare TC 32-1]
MADDNHIPSISSGVVGSRFVSQSDIDSAKARRDEQWKAAYARLGQEPPPQPQEDAYDGRSLAEVAISLGAAAVPPRYRYPAGLTRLPPPQAAKQEEWEEKTKLANQFRALEEDEIMFLDSVREKQEEEERLRKERDGEELKGFREAIASRVVVKSPPAATPQATPPLNPPNGSRPSSAAPAKKDNKRSLKGVLVKKKPKPAPATAPAASAQGATDPKRSNAPPNPAAPPPSKGQARESSEEPPDAKRRRVSRPESDS